MRVTSAKVPGNALTTADIAGADVNGGAINVPPGYVPNGRCRQLDANVGGAKAGEAVVFSHQGPRCRTASCSTASASRAPAT